MTKQISFRDVEKLSAYLDGQLSQADTTRLESRIQSTPELAAVLDDLRAARSILRRTPHRRAPRNFMLTPRMAGIRPPIPRAVPALSWASVVAVVMFVCTLGGNLVGQFSFGAGAPMMAAAPVGMGGGAADEVYAVATEVPVQENAYGTATPEMYALTAPEPTTTAGERITAPPEESQPKTPAPVSPWLVIWPGVAILLAGTALLIRWARERAFARQLRKK